VPVAAVGPRFDRHKSAERTTENIAARRLHTILEKVLDDISFRGAGSEKRKM